MTSTVLKPTLIAGSILVAFTWISFGVLYSTELEGTNSLSTYAMIVALSVACYIFSRDNAKGMSWGEAFLFASGVAIIDLVNQSLFLIALIKLAGLPISNGGVNAFFENDWEITFGIVVAIAFGVVFIAWIQAFFLGWLLTKLFAKSVNR